MTEELGNDFMQKYTKKPIACLEYCILLGQFGLYAQDRV